uniref:hypothetical protein n=1 Tax=Candidatus Pantoea varia TaxID=1881036 RepID=UPI00158707B5
MMVIRTIIEVMISPQSENLAGFFVAVINRGYPNQFGHCGAVTVRIKAITGGDAVSMVLKYHYAF